MKILFSFISFCTFFIYAKIIPSDYIISLNDSNFDEALENYKNIFIEFYVTYCNYCLSFYNNFEEASKLFENKNITFVKVNLEENLNLIKRYNIDYYPYYLLIKKNENFKRIYKRSYTKNEFELFVKKHLYNSVYYLSSFEIFEKYNSNNIPSIIYFLNSKAKNENFQIYNNYSLSEDKYNFFSILKSKENLNNFNITNKNISNELILIKKNFDNFNDEIIINTSLTYDYLFNLIRTYAIPNIIKFDDESRKLIFVEKKPGLILFRDPGNFKIKDKTEEILQKICKEIKSYLQCIISGLMNQDEPKLIEFLGINYSDFPIFFILDTRTNFSFYKFEINDNFNYFSLKNFIDKWYKNLLKENIKSEKIDKFISKDYPIIKLVGNNFEKEIKYNKHEKEDFVVLFYKNSCVKCQSFYSVYEKIAFKYYFKVNKHLKFFKIDIELNDLPNDYYIEKVPFVYFYKANDLNYIKLNYNDVLYEKDLDEFILKYSSFNLKDVTQSEINCINHYEEHPDEKNKKEEDL